ncbi:hypothetical protein GCM10027052_07290 [Parafrigoribacterium mesophilum]|uniref:hypothetical protein n=1 Tax=Parafrigoribacterium mesophilum TaxID=433646 RepID=UPI0031FC2E98
MPEAPRLRPAQHTVLATLHGHVMARPAAVFEALAEQLQPAAADAHFTADPVASLIIVQGDWWYRAELRVVPDDTGSRVEETIVNVAQRAHWAARIAGRRTLADADAAFEKLLLRLRQQLE